MKQLWLTQFPLPVLTCIALILFFAVFCGVIVWTGHSANREKYKRLAQLPIDLDEARHER